MRATTRGRFAWIGAAVAHRGHATDGLQHTQDSWLYGYGIIACFLVPLAFVPLAAVFVASPRARFVESVFTAPVERRDWLTAKILVLLTIAVAYCQSLIPMVLVYTDHVGAPLLLQKLCSVAFVPFQIRFCEIFDAEREVGTAGAEREWIVARPTHLAVSTHFDASWETAVILQAGAAMWILLASRKLGIEIPDQSTPAYAK
jgi:hypothetical protein